MNKNDQLVKRLESFVEEQSAAIRAKSEGNDESAKSNRHILKKYDHLFVFNGDNNINRNERIDILRAAGVKYVIRTDIRHPRFPFYNRIQAIRDIPRHNVKAGDFGGWVHQKPYNPNLVKSFYSVQRPFNMSEHMPLFVYAYSPVYKNSNHQREDVDISELNMTFNTSPDIINHLSLSHDGDAWIGGDSVVFHDAHVSGNALIDGHVILQDRSFIGQDAKVTGYISLGGTAGVAGEVHLHQDREDAGKDNADVSFRNRYINFPEYTKGTITNLTGPKYEITDISHPTYPNMKKIRALVDIPRHKVKAGQLGGYIKSESSLSQSGDAWIEEGSVVYSTSIVSGNAFVGGNVTIDHNSIVTDDSIVRKNLGQNTIIKGQAVLDNEQIETKTQYTIINEFKHLGLDIKIQRNPLSQNKNQWSYNNNLKDNEELLNHILEYVKNAITDPTI